MPSYNIGTRTSNSTLQSGKLWRCHWCKNSEGADRRVNARYCQQPLAITVAIKRIREIQYVYRVAEIAAEVEVLFSVALHIKSLNKQQSTHSGSDDQLQSG